MPDPTPPNPDALIDALLPATGIPLDPAWRAAVAANLAVAGFLFLAHAARTWGAGRWSPLAAAALCLATAALVRQNGLILLVAAAVVAALGVSPAQGEIVAGRWEDGRLRTLFAFRPE